MSEKPCFASCGETCRHIAGRQLPSVLVFAMTISLALAVLGGERIGGVDVSVQPLPAMDYRSGTAHYTSHGYVEFRVRLKNLSQEDRVVHLSMPPGRAESGIMLRRTVHVAAGQDMWVSLFQPPVPLIRETLEVSVEGMREPLRLNTHSLYQGYDPRDEHSASVLISRGVPQDFREMGSSDTATSPKPRRGPTSPFGATSPQEPFVFFRSEVAVSQWSPHWLGYSCYDGIVVTEEEVARMTPQVRLALRRYLECGGTLLVHGKKVPAVFSEGGVAAEREEAYYIGLGRAVASLADHADWKSTYEKLVGMPFRGYWASRRPSDAYDLLVGEATVPVRGLFVLVLLFGIIIGPGNLWLLSRLKRRIWLWWDVPAISLATCVVVFLYSMLSEGITGHGTRASLTLLDEGCHRATTIGYVSYYCPLTPSSGPTFSVATDAALLSTDRHSRRYPHLRRRSDLRVVDWTRDQHLSSGWIKARVPAYFQVRKNEDRRERLTVELDANGTPKVVNALGADIERLYFADRSGQIFMGRQIPAGAERALEAVPGRTAGAEDWASVRELFQSASWLDDFQQWMDDDIPHKTLSPGCYLAYLERSPFLDQALDDVDVEDPIAIVYGISQRRDDGR